ncbi:hypothetical protein [Fusobacterium phage Fnu1]|uniref:Uncharacterized protein n=1 Tax=Fusobacterium phage Fnu1 TaxID=2530024 RepID=A0A481W5G4_9CAUD|nr:hypothetical protein KMD24_gp167 [Fusobacterium phage Fnu1]QBJ04104.1 hypothetical protein [Fusobacterium phage Fnu1]
MTKQEQYNKFMEELIKEQCNNNLTFKCTWLDIERLYKENWTKFFKKKYNQYGELIFVKSMKILIEQSNNKFLEDIGYKKFEDRITDMFISFRLQMYTYYRIPDFLNSYHYKEFHIIRNKLIGTYEFERYMKSWVEIGYLKYRDNLIVGSNYYELWQMIKTFPRHTFLKSQYFMNQVELYVADCIDVLTTPQKELYELFRDEVFQQKPITREWVLNSDVKVPTVEEINKEFKEKLNKIKI